MPASLCDEGDKLRGTRVTTQSQHQICLALQANNACLVLPSGHAKALNLLQRDGVLVDLERLVVQPIQVLVRDNLHSKKKEAGRGGEGKERSRERERVCVCECL